MTCAESDPDGVELARRTWTALEKADGAHPLLLVPVGSTEQHGPHLPLGTDTLVAVFVARAVAGLLRRRGERVLVAPAVAYGASGEHQDFPGTLSIGHEALAMLVVEVVRSAAAWAGRIVLVNGHGGNGPTLRAVTGRLRAEGHTVGWTQAAPSPPPVGDAHAGRTETSLMLFLAPDLVVPGAAEAGCPTPIADLLPVLRRHGVRRVSPNGVLGDPTGSSADEGRALFRAMVADVLGTVSSTTPSVDLGGADVRAG
jgi:creatinine amidohydrolase